MPRHFDPKTLSEAIENLAELLEEVEPKIEKTVEKTLEERPVTTLGLTALIFLVIGYLFGRCGRR